MLSAVVHGKVRLARSCSGSQPLILGLRRVGVEREAKQIIARDDKAMSRPSEKQR